MIAAIATAFDSHPLAGLGRELAQHRCSDGLLGCAFQCGLGTRGVGLSLIPDRLQPGDTLLQAGVAEIGDTPTTCARPTAALLSCRHLLFLLRRPNTLLHTHPNRDPRTQPSLRTSETSRADDLPPTCVYAADFMQSECIRVVIRPQSAC